MIEREGSETMCKREGGVRRRTFSRMKPQRSALEDPWSHFRKRLFVAVSLHTRKNVNDFFAFFFFSCVGALISSHSSQICCQL